MKPWIRVGVLALLWGSTFLWTELALRDFPPSQVTFVRSALGALVLTVACFAGGRRLPRDRSVWRHIVVGAFLCNALPFLLFSLGQQRVDSGLAGVLNATTPLWAFAIALAIGAERGGQPARVGGLLLGFAGTVVIFAPWRGTGSAGGGALLILVAAGSYAVAFAYLGRHLVGRGIPTIVLSAAQLIAATGWSLFALPVGGLTLPRPGGTALLALVVLGIFATGLTFHLTYRIIADEGAVNAATVGYLLPPVSVALGALVLDERPGVRVLVGMGAVLVGVALTRRRPPVPVPSRSADRARPLDG
ncbi:DMT family transporter [Streptomyces sp. NBRC 109706]|uniref:DMT family transporter n=1 Tax=Streptomyces sp. NBRC 109706 TaxID=1550035 RepID=UPI00082F9A5E|nr:DMT family transporter [Streptomyces sp. NBRC 109706]